VNKVFTVTDYFRRLPEHFILLFVCLNPPKPFLLEFFVRQVIKNTFPITWLFKITVVSTHFVIEFGRKEHFKQLEETVDENWRVHDIDRHKSQRKRILLQHNTMHRYMNDRNYLYLCWTNVLFGVI